MNEEDLFGHHEHLADVEMLIMQERLVILREVMVAACYTGIPSEFAFNLTQPPPSHCNSDSSFFPILSALASAL